MRQLCVISVAFGCAVVRIRHRFAACVCIEMKCGRDLSVVQYDSEEWEPCQWEPSWNLPQFPSEKWELTYLGPGGLASVFCLP